MRSLLLTLLAAFSMMAKAESSTFSQLHYLRSEIDFLEGVFAGKNYPELQRPSSACGDAMAALDSLQRRTQRLRQSLEKFHAFAEKKGSEPLEAKFQVKFADRIKKNKIKLSEFMEKIDSTPAFMAVLDNKSVAEFGCNESDFTLVLQIKKRLGTLYSQFYGVQEAWLIHAPELAPILLPSPSLGSL